MSREEFERVREFPVFKGNIVSDSMEPLLRIGDKIIVDVGNKELNRFDLIVFWSEGKLICHFVWAMNRFITPFLLQTRSLKYNLRDVPINWDDYLGKVVSHKLSRWHKLRILIKTIIRRKK